LGGPGGGAGWWEEKKKVGDMFFRKDGVGLTDKGKIAEGFCEFYSQVGPKLAAKIKRERGPSLITWGTGWRNLSSGGPPPLWRWRSYAGPWMHIRGWVMMRSPHG
jgi:hypothetical protein